MTVPPTESLNHAAKCDMVCLARATAVLNGSPPIMDRTILHPSAAHENAGATRQFAPPLGVSVQSVLRTDQLAGRPARPPDRAAEKLALAILNYHLDKWPSTILQRLV